MVPCPLYSLRARVGRVEVNDVWLPAADERRVSRHCRIVTHVTSMKISCAQWRTQVLELKHNTARTVVRANGCDLPAIDKADTVKRQHAHERRGHSETLDNKGSSNCAAVHEACLPALDQSTVVIRVEVREKEGAAPGYLTEFRYCCHLSRDHCPLTHC